MKFIFKMLVYVLRKVGMVYHNQSNRPRMDSQNTVRHLSMCGYCPYYTNVSIPPALGIHVRELLLFYNESCYYSQGGHG